MSLKLLAGLLMAGLGSSPAVNASAPAPSLELLEFLAEFGDVEANTFDLIEYHARQDIGAGTSGPEDLPGNANGEPPE